MCKIIYPYIQCVYVYIYIYIICGHVPAISMFDDLMIPEGTIFGVSSSCTPSLHAWCDIVLGLLQRSQPADQPRLPRSPPEIPRWIDFSVLGSVKFSTSIAPLSFQVRSTFLPSRCACRFEIPVVTVD